MYTHFGVPAPCEHWEPRFHYCEDYAKSLFSQSIFQVVLMYFALLVLRFNYAIVAGNCSVILYASIVVASKGSTAIPSAARDMQTWVYFFPLLLTWIIVLITRWKLERSRRRLFHELALKQIEVCQQKMLRCAAEFHRELHPPRDRRSVSISGQESVASSAVLFDVEGSSCTHEVLEMIMRLGRKEHWLVPSEEVEFSKPLHVIGRGSYGTVVRGTIQGKSVAIKLMTPDPYDRRPASGRSRLVAQ
ncbi:unnamed protein product, partial [Polarella glacialis]